VGLKKVDHIEIKSGMLFTRDWGEQGKGWLRRDLPVYTKLQLDRNLKFWCAIA
jgi:hypothetical protein